MRCPESRSRTKFGCDLQRLRSDALPIPTAHCKALHVDCILSVNVCLALYGLHIPRPFEAIIGCLEIQHRLAVKVRTKPSCACWYRRSLMATQPHVQRADLKQKVKKVLLLPEAVSGILASAFSELFRSRSRSPHPLDVARYRTGLKLAADGDGTGCRVLAGACMAARHILLCTILKAG